MGTGPVSIHDHEAFATKHMTDLGHDVEEFQAFHWNLRGWNKLEKKLTSLKFDCGGHKWRILLFPFGNSTTPPTDAVSVYLDNANPTRREGWHACAQFALAISNPHDPTAYIVGNSHHRFTAEGCDWGFKRFSELQNLFQVQPGNGCPVIEGDSTVVSVYVRVLKDPTGALWNDFISYDSKKLNAHVGLRNLGATGYMNTVLQCLFHIHYFRKAVYETPTEVQCPTKSVTLALQRTFYLLQTSDRPVDATELTRSLGWESVDLLISNDVQEFNRVLLHELESEMEGTHAEGTIAKLFVGKMKSLIKCVSVDYESTRVEEFDEIQLKVKGTKTLYGSLRDYVSVTTLNGEHGHQAGEFGLQDARAATTFQSLPPVLHLRLKRYEYDAQRDAMAKINDPFEFPMEIDFDEFLDETADRTEPWKYKLYGVFVHSGNTHGGHNFALIKPDRHSRWLKFDDDRVTPVTDRELLESYCGEPSDGVAPQAQTNHSGVMKRSESASVLVYIRKAAIDEVMAPFTWEDTPPHLGRRLSEERAQVEEKKKKKEEPHLFLTAKVITDETFSRHQGFDLAIFDKKGSLLSSLPIFQVTKQTTYSAFKSIVAKHFSYPESRIRLWVLTDRQNKTVRLDVLIPENQSSSTVEEIRNNMTPRQSDLWLYLDLLPDPPKNNQPNNAETITVFLKHFDTTKQSLLGIGKVDIPKTSKVKDLIPIVNERMKWSSKTRLKFYEEIKPGTIELMKHRYTLAQSEIQDGDIICFQIEISDREVRDLESRGSYTNAEQFYEFLQQLAMKPGEGRPVRLGSPQRTDRSKFRHIFFQR